MRPLDLYDEYNYYKKIKHNRELAESREQAGVMLHQGKLSYSRMENPDDASLTKKIVSYLNSPEVLKQVSLLSKDKLTHTRDGFISCFGKGDFLSRHTDVSLGKYAFIIFLNQNGIRSERDKTGTA